MNGESKRGIGRGGGRRKVRKALLSLKAGQVDVVRRRCGGRMARKKPRQLKSHSCMPHPCLYSYLPVNRCREKAVRSVKMYN